MNLLFHLMIAISKAGRSNSTAAAGLQYCSCSDSAGQQNCSAAARLSSNNCPAATARTAVPQRQHGSAALADQLWHCSGRGRPRAAQPQQQQNPAVARVGCLAHLGNAGLHVQTGPSVHSTQRSEHGSFCGPENSNKQRQKHRQGNKRRQPGLTPRTHARARALSCECGTQHADRGTKNCSGK